MCFSGKKTFFFIHWLNNFQEREQKTFSLVCIILCPCVTKICSVNLCISRKYHLVHDLFFWHWYFTKMCISSKRIDNLEKDVPFPVEIVLVSFWGFLVFVFDKSKSENNGSKIISFFRNRISLLFWLQTSLFDTF